ncbi:MAG: hypothetical protein LQ340_002892 [Diploschistes diacapsis]|nr:MAG: hypothetical protein LQ340_002892 [Diploschistes diacapsis]
MTSSTLPSFTERTMILWTAGSLFLFVLLRSRVALVSTFFCDPDAGDASPGECYWYTQPWSRWQIGIYLHLWSVFSGSLLAITQFVPSIRARRPKVHRTVGYTCWACGITAAISAIMISDRAFGGMPSARLAMWALALFVLAGHFQAYKAIKSYRIDEHRAWMLRTWVTMGGIVSMRPFMISYAIIISLLRKFGAPGIDYYAAIQLPCAQVFYMLNIGLDIGNVTRKPDFFATYGSECAPGLVGMTHPATPLNAILTCPLGGYAAISQNATATLMANVISKRIDQFAPAMSLSFGPAAWVCCVLHLVFVEMYLRNTTDEAQRLKKLGDAKRRSVEKKLQKQTATHIAEDRGKVESDKTERDMAKLVIESAKTEVKETQMEGEQLSAMALSDGRVDGKKI